MPRQTKIQFLAAKFGIPPNVVGVLGEARFARFVWQLLSLIDFAIRSVLTGVKPKLQFGFGVIEMKNIHLPSLLVLFQQVREP